MFSLPTMTVPMSALGAFQSAPMIDFGAFSAVGLLALVPAGLAISLFLVLLVARDTTRRAGRRARTAERTRAAAAAHLSHAA